MALEFTIETSETNACYSFETLKLTAITQLMIIDWAAMVKTILTEANAGLSIQQLSVGFHNTPQAAEQTLNALH